MVKTLEWTDAGVRLIDQTRLPTEEIYVTCRDHREVATAIRDMIVRGAPAIGVSAAMGVALGVRNSKAKNIAELRPEFDEICKTLASTRPTAVNLFWAIQRMRDRFEELSSEPLEAIKRELIEEAQRMNLADIAACKMMGRKAAFRGVAVGQ